MDWAYWLYGGGRWMSRWHCSGGDFAACVVATMSCLLMFALYCVYAYQNHRGLKLVSPSPFRDHLIDLRNVFMVCGLIHVISSVMAWWVPLYYVCALAMIGNSYQCLRLLGSKKATLAIQQHTRGIAAESQVSEIKEVVRVAQREGILESLADLERVLKSKVSK